MKYENILFLCHRKVKKEIRNKTLNYINNILVNKLLFNI